MHGQRKCVTQKSVKCSSGGTICSIFRLDEILMIAPKANLLCLVLLKQAIKENLPDTKPSFTSNELKIRLDLLKTKVLCKRSFI